MPNTHLETLGDEPKQILVKIRFALESEYGCTYIEGRSMYFFETPYFEDFKRNLECFVLDSAYAAIAASELVVRFRAYVQLKEYLTKGVPGYIKLSVESAEYYARNEIETALKRG